MTALADSLTQRRPFPPLTPRRDLRGRPFFFRLLPSQLCSDSRLALTVFLFIGALTRGARDAKHSREGVMGALVSACASDKNLPPICDGACSWAALNARVFSLCSRAR